MKSNTPLRVTFGIVNYNRLFYLKSCAKSLVESVADYKNVEFFCVDDDSTERGTKEYLDFLSDSGWTVINQQEHRTTKKEHSDVYNDFDHAFPYFDALNLMFEHSTGDLFVPIQGDLQFVRKGWLLEYVSLFKERDDVACVMLDAQRRQRLERSYFDKIELESGCFAIERGRRIPAAGDCVLDSRVVNMLGKWSRSKAFDTPEDDFVARFETIYGRNKTVCVPWIPPALSIVTDPRGTNARIRNDKRYGKYWEAENDLYYDWVNKEQLPSHMHRPVSIEELAIANGNWQLPVDEYGDWKKLNANQVDLEDYELIE